MTGAATNSKGLGGEVPGVTGIRYHWRNASRRSPKHPRLQCLERLFKAEPRSKIETRHRVRGRINKVFEWCIVHNYISHNPADRRILCTVPKCRRKVTHLRSLPYQHCPEALEHIEASLASMLCFRFIILTAVRYGEARYAVWSEIDWAEHLWRIPASRMKNRRNHTVPFSDASLAALKRAK